MKKQGLIKEIKNSHHSSTSGLIQEHNTHCSLCPQACHSFASCAFSTSQVLDEVLQLHLPLGLDVGAVHVGVEEDDGERQDEDGVGVSELPHHRGVADAVALAVDVRQERRHSVTHLENLGLQNAHKLMNHAYCEGTFSTLPGENRSEASTQL